MDSEAVKLTLSEAEKTAHVLRAKLTRLLIERKELNKTIDGVEIETFRAEGRVNEMKKGANHENRT